MTTANKKFTSWAGSIIAIISIVGSAYAWHHWHSGKATNFIYEKVQDCILPIDIKLDVIMTREQKAQAAAILKEVREERMLK
jgi:hypothetical protein